MANVLQINKEIIRAETESVFKEIEIPKRVEKKVVNINLIQILAQTMGAIRSLFSEIEKEKFLKILKKYLVYSENVNLEIIPDTEIEKEIFHIDRLKEVSEFDLVKYVSETLCFTIQKILEGKINILKEKIKSSENVEENLQEIQNLTKLNMGLKKEIYG